MRSTVAAVANDLHHERRWRGRLFEMTL